jgi:3',5'-cyclic AMP phosphodiesterase CpdA
VIDYRLPSTSKVLLIGDWGTHMSDNVALLRQALKKLRPDAVIHLGDVYYSGTQWECEQNVLNVLDALVAELKIARPPFFTVPGNHDYYSGGRGFYDMIGRINAALPGCAQKASYFCLRSADDHWQFLGMDTGYNDRDPINQAAPGLVQQRNRMASRQARKLRRHDRALVASPIGLGQGSAASGRTVSLLEFEAAKDLPSLLRSRRGVVLGPRTLPDFFRGQSALHRQPAAAQRPPGRLQRL